MERRIDHFALCIAAAVAMLPALAWGSVPTAGFGALPTQLRRPQTTSAREIELPPADPLTAPLNFSTVERRLFVDAEDGRLDEHSLIEAALIAGGAGDPHEVKTHTDRFAALRDEARRRYGSAADARVRSERIHQLLHEQVLRRYDAETTDLAVTFDTGVYNCASATLLFVALAADAGLSVQPFELPGHVRAAVGDGANRWEIEITSPNWSQAVRRLETPTADRRDISPIGLVAMIYYNQGIDAFHAQHFSAAIAANRRALLLDPDNREARGNLLAAVNNWALALCEAGQLDAAESLLAKGIRFDASHQEFIHNSAYVWRLQDSRRSFQFGND